MLVEDAFVSGSLGQAIFRQGGTLCILDAPQAQPREADSNEVYLFRNAARETAFVSDSGLPVLVEKVRKRLEEEIRFYKGLDGLLIGGDPDFSAELRQRAIARAEPILAANDGVARRIRERFLIPANSQEWDFGGGLKLAQEHFKPGVGELYQPLANGMLDRLADDIADAVREKFGSGLEAAKKREAIVRSGLMAELLIAMARNNQAAISTLVFRRSEFPDLRAVDPSGQVLALLIKRVKGDLPMAAKSPKVKEKAPAKERREKEEVVSTIDPIAAAVQKAIAHHENLRHPVQAGDGLSGVRREIAWITGQLRQDRAGKAERGLLDLIERQTTRSRPGDIIKTLTSVADVARKSNHLKLAWRILNALALFENLDAAAHCARGGLLRELGRPEEALAAFADTMRRFPQDEVAPNAYAETLRELGRPEEALAAFADTMRRFPQDEVAPNAYAHILAETGRFQEAEQLLVPHSSRLKTRRDWIAMHILAMIRLRAGRNAEAISMLENGVHNCSFPAQNRYFANSLPIALIAAQRADEATTKLETLSQNSALTRAEGTNILMFRIHALADSNKLSGAKNLAATADVIDFATIKQKRLVAALTERYCLNDTPAPTPARAQQLSQEITRLEFDLIRPRFDIVQSRRRTA